MPLTFLIAQLRSLWRHMKSSKHLPERSRPLEERKLALLEFVCLAHPDLDWRERFERWNQRQPRRWRYPSRDAFTTACHDAEKQLTGRRGGLRWYYDRFARMSRRELRAQADGGEVAAKREIERRRSEGLDSFERAGMRVVRHPATPSHSPKRGAQSKGGQHGTTRER